jgi:hypothetical protein
VGVVAVTGDCQALLQARWLVLVVWCLVCGMKSFLVNKLACSSMPHRSPRLARGCGAAWQAPTGIIRGGQPAHTVLQPGAPCGEGR